MLSRIPSQTYKQDDDIGNRTSADQPAFQSLTLKGLGRFT